MKRVLGGIFICFLVIAQVSQFPPSGGGGTTYSFSSPLGESGGTVSCATCATTSSNVATATALAANPTDCAANTYATTIAANGNLTCASITNAATTAVSTNTASTIVLRDGSGNFSAGTITAALTGNASTATALAANPSDCSAGQFATAIAANGNLTCGDPTGNTAPPADNTWTVVSAQSGTLATSGNVLTLIQTGHGGSNAPFVVDRAAPATPYTIIAKYLYIGRGGSYFGMGWRQASDSKMIEFAFPSLESSNFNARVLKWTNATTFSADYVSNQTLADTANIGVGVMSVKLVDNGTNRVLSWSIDNGQSWNQIHSVGRTDFLTADRIMAFTDCQSSSPIQCYMSLIDYEVQ